MQIALQLGVQRVIQRVGWRQRQLLLQMRRALVQVWLMRLASRFV